MQMLRLIVLVSFFVLPTVEAWLIAVPAYACCSRCGMPCGGCFCPGTGGCAYCATPEPGENTIPSSEKSAVRTEPASVSSVSVPSFIIPQPNIDRLIRLASARQCDRTNFRLDLTDGKELLKLDEAFSNKYAKEQGSLEIQVASNDGK